MSKKKYSKKNTDKKSRRWPALALLLLILLLFFFVTAKTGPIKDARDALKGRLTQLSGESSTNSEADEPASDDVSDQSVSESKDKSDSEGGVSRYKSVDPDNLPEYDGNHYAEINGGEPEFSDGVYEKAGLIRDGEKWKTKGSLLGTIDSDKITAYEHYDKLDKLGRCGAAYGCLGRETMPEEGAERGDISSVHPSGWARGQNWERCHLIAWSLSAENDNEGNLITGTHYLNYDGMRPFEEETSHYIRRTGNHVLYMAGPVYKGDEPVPRGIHMVCRSVEDNGEGLSFNVYCFNVTPGAEIDYRTGVVTTREQAEQGPRLYVINKRSGIFHYPSCDGAREISGHNREEVTATRRELTAQGYMPCGSCEP